MRGLVITAAMLWLGVAARAQPPPADAWQEAPAYLRLFAPSGARAAAYRTFVTALTLDRLLAALADDGSLLRPRGAWSAAPLVPADAFGQTGRYDRSRLARLYGAGRPRVARGPRGDAVRFRVHGHARSQDTARGHSAHGGNAEPGLHRLARDHGGICAVAVSAGYRQLDSIEFGIKKARGRDSLPDSFVRTQ